MVLMTVVERIRSVYRKTFGNHQTLDEENEEVPIQSQDPCPSRSVTTDYTELMGGSVPCPSCKGTGKIPREMEETLVALIPLNDERLKPKKTWLYVLVGIGACTMIASIAIFMLVPREVELIGNREPVNVVNITDAKPKELSFFFMNFVNISNYNYYTVQVLNTSATVTDMFYPWNKDQSGTGYNSTLLTIAPLSYSKNQLWFNNTVRVINETAEYCQASFSKITPLWVTMRFDVTVQLMYFNHREQVAVSFTQQVCCNTVCAKK